MSRLLELELDDEVYAAVQRRAQAAGTSPAHWIRQLLEAQYGSDTGRKPGKPARHFGAIDVPDATAADNARIDADLAREYADRHEAS